MANKNLYKILFSHSCPKDTEEGMKELLLAENDEEIYDYVDAKYNYSSWKYEEEKNEVLEMFDEHWDVIGTETFREKIIRISGEMYDEWYEYTDLYYGVTLYGWELISENVDVVDCQKLIELRVVDCERE